jgi:hypothetical protein
MGETAGTVILLLLAIYGCVQGVRSLILRLLRPGTCRGIWLIPLRGRREDGEYLVRWAAALCRWGSPPGRETYLLDLEGDAAACETVRRTCGEVGGVRLIRPEELTEVLTVSR